MLHALESYEMSSKLDKKILRGLYERDKDSKKQDSKTAKGYST